MGEALENQEGKMLWRIKRVLDRAENGIVIEMVLEWIDPSGGAGKCQNVLIFDYKLNAYYVM